MILIDTNIVSEIMRPEPAQSVLSWINGQNSSTLHVSTITIAEIGYGLRVMPDGKRRRQLRDRFEKFIAEGFEQRIVVFDEHAARIYPEIMGRRREIGRPLGLPDGQIASIAHANRFTLATHNTCDFEECRVELINPFDKAG